MPYVYSHRAGAYPAPFGAVYVGRGTPYGNQFIMTHEKGEDVGSRAWACAEFEKYAEGRHRREPNWLKPLVGKDLICWCAPKQCHADILLRLANKAEAEAAAAEKGEGVI